MGYTFANPLQVDFSKLFNADTVANSSANGQSYPPLVPMDGSGYDYFTEAVADNDFDFGAGLPNDGFYASNGDHPDVQLAFSDTSVGSNTFIMNDPSTNILTVTFPIVMTAYSTVQVYGTSTEGSSSLTLTLTYADTSTDVTSLTIPDWFNSFDASTPVFVVQESLSRFSSSGDDYSTGAALYGATAVANPAKALASVTVTTTGASGRFVLFGATAY